VGQHFNQKSSVYETVGLLIVRGILSAGMRKKKKSRRKKGGGREEQRKR